MAQFVCIEIEYIGIGKMGSKLRLLKRRELMDISGDTDGFLTTQGFAGIHFPSLLSSFSRERFDGHFLIVSIVSPFNFF